MVKDLKEMIRKGFLGEDEACDECGMPMEDCSCEPVIEVAPPGREKQVKGLKKHMKKGGIPKTFFDKKTGKRKKSNPWALAWVQQSAHGSPKKG